MVTSDPESSEMPSSRSGVPANQLSFPQVTGTNPPRSVYRSISWSSQRLYRPYITSAFVVALTLGFTTGTLMVFLPALGLSVGRIWATHLQSHGVAQIFGWAGLFLMGLAFHIVPRIRNTSIAFPWPQRIVLILILLAVCSRFVGQTVTTWNIHGPLLLTSGMSLAIGLGLFTVVIGSTLWRGTARRGPAEAWLWMSLFWLVVAAAIYMDTVVQMMSGDPPIAPAPADGAFIHAALVGFIMNFVFGISLRVIPAFLGLPPLKLNIIRLSLVAVNGGVAITTLGLFTSFVGWVPVWGALLELGGFVAFVGGVRLYFHRKKSRNYTLKTYTRYEWYLRASYGWLVVGGSFQLWNTLVSILPGPFTLATLAAPTLHVFGLGFVTMIIMGMAARMIPIFEGAVLPMQRLMDAIFVLINASVLLRLGFGIIPTGMVWFGLTLSGSLGTLSIACFALIIWQTIRHASRQRYSEIALAFGQQRLASGRSGQDK